MIDRIQTIDDVRFFFTQLLNENLNFHPDDPFEDYVYIGTGIPVYTPQEAAVRNRLLAEAFDVCENNNADIYELCMEIFMSDFYKLFSPEH